MKKFTIVFTLLFALVFFFSFKTPAHASVTVVPDGATYTRGPVERIDGAIRGSVSGSLTGNGINYITTNPNKYWLLWHLVVRYKNATTVDDANFKANTIFPDSFAAVVCDWNRDNNTFSCPFESQFHPGFGHGDDLAFGSVFYQLGIQSGNRDSTWVPLSEEIDQFEVSQSTVKSGARIDEGSLKSTVIGGEEQISGKFDASVMALYSSLNPQENYALYYGKVMSDDSNQVHFADLSNKIPLKFTEWGTSTPGFSATISGLAMGSYVAAIKVENKYFLSSYIPFSITSETVANFTMPSTPTVEGRNATVLVNAKNLPTKGGVFFLELGAAKTQSEGSSNFTCVLDQNYMSPAITVTPTAGGVTPIQNVFSIQNDGYYCAGIKQFTTDGSTQTPVNTPEYFLNSLFAVGKTLPDNATLDSKANALGCVAGENNSGYCLLAPLPGIGDEKGYLDVTTGMGNYINMIIKLVMGLIGVLSVLMVVVGGIEYMSTVSVGEKEGAKSRITNALFGLLLTLSAYLILKTINPKLVDLTINVPEGAITDFTSGLTSDLGTPFPTGSTPVSTGTYTGNTSGKNDIGTDNITTYDKVLSDAAHKHGVDCTFLKAIMYRESHGNPGATSSKGAVGLMQMMPNTWNGLGYKDQSKWKDAAYSADASAYYVKTLKGNACDGKSKGSNTDCDATLSNYINGYITAAYNAGSHGANAPAEDCPGKTRWECQKNQGGLKETEIYVGLVLNNYQTLVAKKWGCN